MTALSSVSLSYLLRAGTMEVSSDEEEVRTFVKVISEKYNPENFPYGQGIGVVILPSPPGSPVKGEREFISGSALSDVFV